MDTNKVYTRVARVEFDDMDTGERIVVERFRFDEMDDVFTIWFHAYACVNRVYPNVRMVSFTEIIED